MRLRSSGENGTGARLFKSMKLLSRIPEDRSSRPTVFGEVHLDFMCPFSGKRRISVHALSQIVDKWSPNSLDAIGGVHQTRAEGDITACLTGTCA